MIESRSTLCRGDRVRDARNPRRHGTVDAVGYTRVWVYWDWSGRIESVPRDHLRIITRHRRMRDEIQTA